MAVQQASVVVLMVREDVFSLADLLYIRSPIITLETGPNRLELGVVKFYPGNAGPKV